MVFIMAKVIMVFIPIHQVCDADLRILSLDATYPGSVHDSFVWRYSLLREAFIAGHLVGDDECLLGEWKNFSWN